MYVVTFTIYLLSKSKCVICEKKIANFIKNRES